MNYTPGFILVLHTFGRDLKWNPHIHCILSSFGYDPLKCPECGTTMHFLELYFERKRISLEEMYEKEYTENPPEGMNSRDIRSMSDEALLDMDYFLNEDELDDGFGEEGFYIF